MGMVEFNSIAAGINAADCMLKASAVSLICAKTACPGKYICMVRGEVGAVKASVEAARRQGGGYLVDELIIASVEESVCAAISGSTEVPSHGALGIMEFFGMAGAVVAADTAAKAADVSLIEVRMGMGIGGKAFVALCGDVAAVGAAVDAGCSEAAEQGMLLNKAVIPAPDQALFESLV